ncbi:glycosyltransferase family 90 protein [Dothidotthia symphoricarpi CBS 119687]|uniref:Glycosyltransferase family 90 protein n=1 Tax=Dothidotthia symphoricarpi CBS 119687 TaxID=1392245 RepID=A0A6A6AC02_9PLEO|nr:glycosyltransferase family 90 protein [Dothidotthia symphoricarpi CBS 119687]KAF2128534.1 glycosyltransferase family 90 protein [Dothidotthia symphoricarpi CBS 119687]
MFLSFPTRQYLRSLLNWNSRLNSMDTASGLAVATVLCSVLAQHLFTPQRELCSETLSWVILPILFKIGRWPNTNAKNRSSCPETQSTSTISLWVVAASLTISCLYKAEMGMVELLPILTPLLLVARHRLRPEFSASRTSSSWLFSPLAWGTTLSALFITLTLSNGDFLSSALSIVAVVSQLLVYVTFLPRTISTSRLLPLIDDIENDVMPLSWRVVTILTITMAMQTTMIGVSGIRITSVLLLGVFKALSWYFTIRMTRYASWCIAPAIGTFSLIAARDPFLQSSEVRALCNVIASFLALAQIVHILPKQAKGRSYLWVLSLVFLAPYLANVLAIRAVQSSARLSFGGSHEHPVENLVNNAKVNFGILLQNQSQNYLAAYGEYRRRYGMEPPNGFEAWYEFAVSHQSPIIDDFDIIHKSVSPFWKMSGNEVLQKMHEAQAMSNGELWSCVFSSSHAETHCSHPYRTFDRHIELLFNRLLGNLSVMLPDVRFLVNHLDEPRVLIPTQSLKGKDDSRDRLLNLTNMSRQPVWDVLTRYCASQRRDTSAVVEHAVETFALPFVTDSSSALDMCQHQEYQAMYGLVMHPTSFRLFEGLVPIFTTGSLSTMGDILFPSPAYMEAEFQYNEEYDIEWEKKRNNLYWAGSTTGGYALDDQWRYYQRQRFVTLAQRLEPKRHTYLREKEGMVNRVESSFLNSRLFDVAFTRVFQCETKYCRDQKAYFKLKPWADRFRPLGSRLAFDLDGNGISGRYYQILASKSVPLKQTLLREWHDDRLVPWVHYIPVSQSMEEVPELVSYLTSSETGQQKAREIAERGREWFSRAFREIDMSIYTYRLLLEIARLQDPKRQASPN